MWNYIASSTIRADYVTIAVTFFIIGAMFVAWIYSLGYKHYFNINNK